MASERSRTIIRTHHRLQKEHAAAVKKGDAEAAEQLSLDIERNGGLKTYQAASKQGQAKDRGGDSSKVLVEWLQQMHVLNAKNRDQKENKPPLRSCLEVGALSTKNAISGFPSVVEMTRIDLNSQEPGIKKQDFMARPLPTSNFDRFDIISLSLVLNYVPDAAGRGAMLKRIPEFLRLGASHADTHLPLLFLVLPLPCVKNSRYMDEKLLLRVMASLGFTVQNSKLTSKLCYYLFCWAEKTAPIKVDKKKLRDSPGMNNFCIVME